MLLLVCQFLAHHPLDQIIWHAANDNASTGIVNEMEEVRIVSRHKVMWSGIFWLLCHSKCRPIGNKYLLEELNAVSLDHTLDLASHTVQSPH